jgi:PLP dependent protein
MNSKNFSEQVELIKNNLDKVETRIAQAAEKAGRDRKEIRLIAVTKLMPIETIKAGMHAGINDFGENYPEQAQEKMTALSGEQDVTWHMIGHIQSRKASIVSDHFDWVHSVDRIKIANFLERDCRTAGRTMSALIEVNVSGEESKHGWKAWDEDSWAALIPDFKQISELTNIEIRGLMSMPPFFDDPQLTRPYYQRLKRLQNFLQEQLPDTSWAELSIGTSFDYEVAIEEGATMIRLGTTLFGSRPR